MAPSLASDHGPLPDTGTSQTPLKRQRYAEEDNEPKYSLDDEDDEEYERNRYVPLKQRKLMEQQRISQLKYGRRPNDDDKDAKDSPPSGENDHEDGGVVQRSRQILLREARELREKEAKEQKTEEEKKQEEEKKILDAHQARRKLASNQELAKGISYTKPLETSWTPPSFVRQRSDATNEKVREKHHVIIDGEDVPPLIDNFRVCF